MLDVTETFQLSISWVISYQDGGGPSSGSRLICNECIKKLRDATEFKQQVLRNEEKIEKYLSELLNDSTEESAYNSKNEEKEQLDIKTRTQQHDDDDEEIMNNGDAFNDIKSDDDDGFDGGNTDDNDMTNDDDDIQIKQEDDDEEEQPLDEEEKQAIDDEIDEAIEPMLDIIKEENKSTVKKYKKKLRVRQKTAAQKEDQLKLKQMKRNTQKLIWHSTGAVLFKTRHNLYKCILCNREFVKFKLLREHVAEHTPMEILERVRKIKTYRNVDISALSCAKCDTSMNDLEELSKHLSQKHQVPLTKHGYLLVPYKTEHEFRCLVCNEDYKRLSFLINHMNTHYSFHVCELCGATFINAMQVYEHKKTHLKSFRCVICNTKFEKVSQLRQHKKKVHNIIADLKHYCPECSETFQYTYKLDLHRIEKHGKEKPKTEKCDECDRIFANAIGKKTHMRAVHLKEKNYCCSLCPSRFFTKHDKNRHERTHSSECQFICEICLTKFKAKDSLRRHLRRQHGEGKIKS